MRHGFVSFAVLSTFVLVAPSALAQGAPAPAPAPAPGGGGGGAAPAAPQVTVFGGSVAPPGPGQVLGGGNATGSSSRPITGANDRDGFDLGGKGGASNTMRGSENGSFVLGGITGRSSDLHTVRRGDTLWGICDYYFRNPYQWPRIWSYNPQIQNPHWIYPGDQVRLKPGAVEPEQPKGGQGTLTDRRRQVAPGTIFLRNEGFIEDEQAQTWGEVSGAREDKMFLADFDEVYLKIVDDRDVKIGQELTIFRPIRQMGSVKLVQIQGTVRIDFWNAKERVARGRITETLDTIERGARIGPVMRKFEVVPPRRNDVELRATVNASVIPRELHGSDQVVFLDRGEVDGIKPGNRLFVLRQGDAWHQTLPTGTAAQRIAMESQSPADTESIPRPRDETKLPEEVIGEIRVITVRKNTSLAIVTAARREIEAGDQAFARKGY